MTPLEAKAAAMYHKAAPVAPTWDQLGETTKNVWLERAAAPSTEPWKIAGVTHGVLLRSCMGKNGKCGPQSPVGSTRVGGVFRCAACSAERAARLAPQPVSKFTKYLKEKA